MNLVFFDIECASVHKTVAKICAFGYVVCDENFNISEKKDLLVNPHGGFHLTDRKGSKGIILPYSYSEFKKYPDFTEVYPFIKNLLEDKNNVVIGHSTMNDVKYLNLETKRFHLPSFEFSFSDSQLIYMTYIEEYSHQYGLEQIAKDLGVEFTPHRAADDAYATLKIVEAMCRAKGCGYFELVQKLGIKEGKISDYTLKRPSSHGFNKYNAAVGDEKRNRAKLRAEFSEYVSRKRIKRSGSLKGSIFSFSRLIEDDLELSKRLIDGIYANGGVYSHHVSHCNYYVTAADDNTQRTQNAVNLPEVEIIDLNRLEEMFR